MPDIVLILTTERAVVEPMSDKFEMPSDFNASNLRRYLEGNNNKVMPWLRHQHGHRNPLAKYVSQ